MPDPPERESKAAAAYPLYGVGRGYDILPAGLSRS